MNNIITISREFGSGGRELAKRLAEKLGYKYYDKEIIREIAKRSKFDEKYIENVNINSNDDFAYTISKSFSLYSPHQKQATEILVMEQKVIKDLATRGNCVFDLRFKYLWFILLHIIKRWTNISTYFFCKNPTFPSNDHSHNADFIWN